MAVITAKEFEFDRNLGARAVTSRQGARTSCSLALLNSTRNHGQDSGTEGLRTSWGCWIKNPLTLI